MFWSDPNLYGASFAFKEFTPQPPIPPIPPIPPTPFMQGFTPWQNIPRVPTATLPYNQPINPFFYTPYMQYAQQLPYFYNYPFHRPFGF